MIFISWFSLDQTDTERKYPELVKIALREVGNQLLLSDHDSSTAIPPIVELTDTRFELSFQQELSFEPALLIATVKEVMIKADLPQDYIVEVIQCIDKEVAYSYKMTSNEQSTIIPCSGRYLPVNCYTIELGFLNTNAGLGWRIFLYVLGFSTLLLLGFLLGSKRSKIKRQVSENSTEVERGYAVVGSFQFFPEQNKLIRGVAEINLSKKECELLTIFAANPNQIIKRDELTKKVWEDNGVIVGRSLDTYISKLRKKLKADESIKLTNVHGVGYKLEWSE